MQKCCADIYSVATLYTSLCNYLKLLDNGPSGAAACRRHNIENYGFLPRILYFVGFNFCVLKFGL
jgi:hypothetical protein